MPLWLSAVVSLSRSPRPGLSHLLGPVVPSYSDSRSSLIGEKKIELYALNEISIFQIVQHAVNKVSFCSTLTYQRPVLILESKKKPSDQKTVQQLGFS